jgi:hypothetical protein
MLLAELDLPGDASVIEVLNGKGDVFPHLLGELH